MINIFTYNQSRIIIGIRGGTISHNNLELFVFPIQNKLKTTLQNYIIENLKQKGIHG